MLMNTTDANQRLESIFAYIATHRSTDMFYDGAVINYAYRGSKNEYAGKTPLVYAIECNNVEAVWWLLDHDADAGIADEIGIQPILAAVKGDNTGIRKAIYENLSKKSWTKLVSYVGELNRQGLRTKILSILDFSQNQIDSEGNTALMAAIKANQPAIASSILYPGKAPIDFESFREAKKKKDDNKEWKKLYILFLSCEDKQGNSLVSLAYNARNLELLKMLLAENAYISESLYKTAKKNNQYPEKILADEYHDFYQQASSLISNHFRESKRKIMDYGAFFAIPKDNKPFGTIEAILSQTYADLGPYQKEARDQTVKDLSKQLQDVYNDTDTLIKPILELMGQAALGKHLYHSTKNKKYKIISSSESMQLKPGFGTAKEGQYSYKNTAFISIADPQTAFAILLHESTHFAMQAVYNNNCDPFCAVSKKNAAAFNKIIESVIAKIEAQKNKSLKSTLPDNKNNSLFTGIELMFNKIMGGGNTKMDERKNPLAQPPRLDPRDDALFARIESVFNIYPKEDWARELIVKIPEIIGIIGVQNGHKWFKNNFPELLDYYKTVVLPDCKEYVQVQELKYASRNTA